MYQEPTFHQKIKPKKIDDTASASKDQEAKYEEEPDRRKKYAALSFN